ncbi:MAG TPA: AMP-binding protein [Bacteroidota bacterium]|jgi:acyl-[acyl-carrier-protein]-phospholipid O-acyltransferase/long-chain-fatty-acid--[acyl-carrier-protein] ligase|nr:AMP-binding protein [Bacteroidota bacterium]
MLLHHHFVKTAKKYEEKIVITDRTTGAEISYGKALIASLLLAGKFKKYDPGFIGIMIPNSMGSVLAILGVLMSGRIPVMINYSTGAAQNAEYAQQQCAFKTIITSKALLQKINCPKIHGMVFLEDIMESVGIIEKLRAALKSKLPEERLLKHIAGGDIDDTVVILFTSGSENNPKAVQLSHKNILANIEGISQVFDLSSEDVFLANLPYFHVFGLTVNLWLPLHFGMRLVTCANPLDFKEICTMIREEKTTFVVGTPAFMWGYLKKSEPGDFTSCRVMLSGADKTPDALREEFLKKQGIVLLEGYGCTETSPVISANSPTANQPGSVGRPLPNVQVRIENYETGEECPVGEIGKILVKGDNVMKGYFDDFEATSMSMRHGWYDTGDMGYLDSEGYLWHVGRLRRFIKIGGEMVSLIHVENVLERCLPHDVECSVVEVPDPIRGAKIVAVVTQPVNEKKILKQMAEELPNIALPKMFIVMDELPHMGSGKVDFRRLTDLVRDRVQHQRT